MSFDPRPPHWLERFEDLPLLTVPSAQQPRYDGDLALLEELADRILTVPRDQFTRDDIPVSGTSIYNAVCYALGVFPHR